MHRQELIEIIAVATGQTKAATGRFLEVFLKTVQTTVAAGNKVSLFGFGSFGAVYTKERQSRNPLTGEELTVSAHIRPKFTPSSRFKALVREAAQK